MKYKDCTDRELALFVAARKIPCRKFDQDEPRRLQRIEYLLALQESDKKPHFPGFLELPAELRNIIYEHSLKLTAESKCCTQLLSASRQIHQEGTGIFYNINDFHISMTPRGVLCQGRSCGEYRPLGDSEYELGKTAGPDLRELKWPTYLRKVTKLNLTISADDWDCPPYAGFPYIENIVYSLCEFLHGQHCLETLIIEDFFQRESDELGAQPDLYPLRMLGNLATLEFRNLQEDDTIQANNLSYFSKPQLKNFKNGHDLSYLDKTLRTAYRDRKRALQCISKACEGLEPVDHSSEGYIDDESLLSYFRCTLVGRSIAEHCKQDFGRLDRDFQDSFNILIRQALDLTPIPYEIEGRNRDFPKFVRMFLRAHVDCEIVKRVHDLWWRAEPGLEESLEEEEYHLTPYFWGHLTYAILFILSWPVVLWAALVGSKR